MKERAALLAASLGLTPHPEGGHFREVYRSPSVVQAEDGRPPRAAITLIYFLLCAGEVSRWHRLGSDEIWHYCEGDPLELLQADASMETIEADVLGPYGDGTAPIRVVPAGAWQAARSTGAYTLVGCTVGPGFDFADFEMLDPRSAAAGHLRRRHPRLAAFM